MTSLAEALGFAPDARVLILNADDLGLSHAANVGSYEALRSGLVTSASLMVPCPWAREAASRYRGEDVGVHLTLNAEHERYRWGPITQAPSLLDGDGGFPRTVDDLWDHADLDEVRRELRAQVERAISAHSSCAPSSSTSTSTSQSTSACRSGCLVRRPNERSDSRSVSSQPKRRSSSLTTSSTSEELAVAVPSSERCEASDPV